MTVKIKSKEVTGLDDHQYDLSIPGHFGGFIDKLTEMFDRKKEFEIMEIKEERIYFHNLNHH